MGRKIVVVGGSDLAIARGVGMLLSAIDTEKKNAIIAEFAEHLTEEQTADFNAKMDDYSVEDFKKEVCFAAYNTDSSIISGKGEEDKPDLIFKNNAKNTDSGVIALLLKHKGGNR